jgi:hypothetical protein
MRPWRLLTQRVWRNATFCMIFHKGTDLAWLNRQVQMIAHQTEAVDAMTNRSTPSCSSRYSR